MATKSISKNVKIKDRQHAHLFVSALDQAKQNKYKSIQITCEHIELTGDKIKEFFGKNI